MKGRGKAIPGMNVSSTKSAKILPKKYANKFQQLRPKKNVDHVY